RPYAPCRPHRTRASALSAHTAPRTRPPPPPADKARGRSEWDARRIASAACGCLRTLAEQIGARRRDLAGIGLTGPQHGVGIVDTGPAPQMPFINWQDRPGEEIHSQTRKNYVWLCSGLARPERPTRA